MFLKKWLQITLVTALVLGLVGIALLGFAAALIYPELPSLETLTNYQPKLPLRVYSEDGYMIGEFGEERRAFVTIDKYPKNMKSAVLAIEDRRFYQHNGVDIHGILRAVVNNLTGKGREGASTITMQVAKNFFSHGERNLKVKIYEICLSLKIEHSLSKDKILELYFNQIYLGQRAYGFAAASQVYFGKPLDKLTLAETALLAGLPKAPSGYNPFLHPKRAITRQHEVLNNMWRFGFIDEASYKEALNQPLVFKTSKQSSDLSADYVAEIVRQAMYERYQDKIYSSGLKVYTTILKTNQEAANASALQGILDYDQRHGYRGPEKQLDLKNPDESLDKQLDEFEEYGGLIPAIVTSVGEKQIKVHAQNGEDLTISGDGLSLVQRYITDKNKSRVDEKLQIRIGSVVRIAKISDSWKVTQLPQVESAFVAMDPQTGAVRALFGGFDFNRNKFNHVTQAWRQPGSSFKPFIYSAALEKGYTPASIVEDEPITFPASQMGMAEDWVPHNFDDKYEGPIRLRTALTKSKNMVSIRVLDSIGVKYAQDYITRFGFSAKDHPAYLTMALGAGSVTPWQLAEAYSVFANGGFHVKPYLISKIVNSKGEVVEQATILPAGNGAPRVIDSRNAFIMTSMMQDVTRVGTAAKARQLGRDDLAGKTGTTNNQFDTWFAGYNPKQVAVVWMGFDQPQSLGKSETGGLTALPTWIHYMSVVLKGVPDLPYEVPEGVDSIKIDLLTGTRAKENESGYYDYFYREYPPPELEQSFEPIPGSSNNTGNSQLQPEQLY